VLQHALCSQLYSLNVSLLLFKANNDGCELFCVDCEWIYFVGKVGGNDVAM
jgi:hypothetical protein